MILSKKKSNLHTNINNIKNLKNESTVSNKI